MLGCRDVFGRITLRDHRIPPLAEATLFWGLQPPEHPGPADPDRVPGHVPAALPQMSFFCGWNFFGKWPQKSPPSPTSFVWGHMSHDQSGWGQATKRATRHNVGTDHYTPGSRPTRPRLHTGFRTRQPCRSGYTPKRLMRRATGPDALDPGARRSSARNTPARIREAPNTGINTTNSTAPRLGFPILTLKQRHNE